MANEYAETEMVRIVCSGIEGSWKLASTPRDYHALAYTFHGAALAAITTNNEEAAEEFRVLSDLASHMEHFQ